MDIGNVLTDITFIKNSFSTTFLLDFEDVVLIKLRK